MINFSSSKYYFSQTLFFNVSCESSERKLLIPFLLKLSVNWLYSFSDNGIQSKNYADFSQVAKIYSFVVFSEIAFFSLPII